MSDFKLEIDDRFFVKEQQKQVSMILSKFFNKSAKNGPI